MSKINSKLLVFIIILLGCFLLFYRLNDLMPFIGDQGWFYLSARDMLLNGQVPLVGITSSHIWLHQGPFWTYMLASALWIGHFNPVSGAYLTATIGLVTVWLVYKIGSEMFSQRIGLIASLIYATSPLIIFFARMPYHTEPIALLTLLLLYAIYKWIKGYRFGFPFIILLFSLLYNFELSTFMLVPIFLIVFIYGLIKKEKWVKNLIKKEIIFLSLLCLLIPMIPIILYDMHHGYPQTVKFAVWIGYKIATVFGYPKIHPDIHGETFQTMLPFASRIVQRMIFLQNAFLSWIILGITFINLVFLNKKYFKKREFLQPYSILLLFFVIPAAAYIAEKTNSDAYWIVFFPTIAFMIALVFDQLMRMRMFFYPTFVFLAFLILLNCYTVVQANFLVDSGFTFTKRLNISKQIVQESYGKEYNLMAKGNGSQYISFTMNYQYLAWWLGHGSSKTNQPLKFIIEETPTNIVLTKKVVKNKL